MRTTILMCLILLAGRPILAQDDVRQEIESLVKLYHEQGRFTGSVLAATDGEILYADGVGMANVEWGIPNTPDTRFRVGSITKQFTAAVVLQLVSEGRAELDDSITRHLPEYRRDTGDRVTLHHLLTHSSGIPSYTSNPDFWDDAHATYKVDEFVEGYCSGDLDFQPGSEYRYNNSGYFLLGAIIEAVTGNTYAEELQDRIFDPLGMTGSGYDTHEAIIEKRAIGYTPTYDGLANSAFLLACSTIRDLASVGSPGSASASLCRS